MRIITEEQSALEVSELRKKMEKQRMMVCLEWLGNTKLEGYDEKNALEFIESLEEKNGLLL